MGTNLQFGSYFDNNGNITELEHVRDITWNYRDNISSATMVERADDKSDVEYYVYDSSGERIRKVRHTWKGDGIIEIEEKIYLGAIEIKRIRQINSSSLTVEKKVERSSLHVMDDQSRIAIVHNWTLDTAEREVNSQADIGENKIRYQYGNHLGSASLELDTLGNLISYEEYFPYGGTSFTAGKNQKEVKLKEYRYTGKERDDFTGLYYYGARYYAPWLGRWMSADPSGPQDGLNLYEYVSSNPIGYIDPDGNEKKEPGSFKKAWDFSLGFLKAAGKFANENATMMLESHPLSPMFDPKAVWDRNMNLYQHLYNEYRIGGEGKDGLFYVGKQLLPLSTAKKGLDQTDIHLEHGDYEGAGEHYFDFVLDYGGFLFSAAMAAKAPTSSKTSTVPEAPPPPKLKRGNRYSPFRKKKAPIKEAKKYGVVDSVIPDDIRKKILIDGSYVKNPTAQYLSEMITESGKIGGKKMSGVFMYVVDNEGNIIIGSRGSKLDPTKFPARGGYAHPTLIGGENPQILGAGMVDIRGGKIYKSDNISGHFQPGAESLKAVKKAFEKIVPEKGFKKDFQGYVPYKE